MSARLHLQAARLIREFDVPAVELRRKALKPCHGIRSFRFNRKCPVVLLLQHICRDLRRRIVNTEGHGLFILPFQDRQRMASVCICRRVDRKTDAAESLLPRCEHSL